jgi:WD40-like Beta Propeller Repeat
MLIDMRSGRQLADLEKFAVTKNGERFSNRNFNFWGVTFAPDDNRFYATLDSGRQTYLVQGSLRARTMRVIHDHVECPSLSPDGTRIAFRRSTGGHGTWRLYVLDLRTMREHPLAETTSIDDQLPAPRVVQPDEQHLWHALLERAGRLRQSTEPLAAQPPRDRRHEALHLRVAADLPHRIGEDRIDLLGGNHAFELGVQGVRRARHGDLHRGVELPRHA